MSIDFAKAWEIFVSNFPQFLYGIEITVLYAIVGTAIGLLIGLLVGTIRAIEINEQDPVIIKSLKKILKLITKMHKAIFQTVQPSPANLQMIIKIWYWQLPPKQHKLWQAKQRTHLSWLPL